MIKDSKLFSKNALLVCASVLAVTSAPQAFAQVNLTVETEGGVMLIPEGMGDVMDEGMPMPESIENDSGVVTMDYQGNIGMQAPDENALVNAGDPVSAPVDGAVMDTGATVIPHSGAYYDASSFGGDSISSTAPREVDPAYEPATRFVVVERSAGAGSFSSQLVAAQRALSLGRNAAALEMYESLYQKNRKNTRVLMGLAVAQQKSGFTESAMETYDELLKQDPNNSDATVNMLGLMSSMNPERAYSKLQDMWEKNGRNPAVASQLGFTAAELGDYERAIRYLGVASSMEPNNPNHYYNLGVISDRAGMVKQAIEYYQKSLEMDASTNAFRTVSRDVVYDRLATLRRL